MFDLFYNYLTINKALIAVRQGLPYTVMKTKTLDGAAAKSMAAALGKYPENRGNVQFWGS